MPMGASISRGLSGGTVTVVVSLGKERYDVPKLKGMTVDEAQDALVIDVWRAGKGVRRIERGDA